MKKIMAAISSVMLLAVLTVSLFLFVSGNEVDYYYDQPPLNIYTLWDWFYSNDVHETKFKVALDEITWDDELIELTSVGMYISGNSMFCIFSMMFGNFGCGEMLSPQQIRNSINELYSYLRRYHGDDAVIDVPLFNSRFDDNIVWDWDELRDYLQREMPHVFQYMYKYSWDAEWHFTDTKPRLRAET